MRCRVVSVAALIVLFGLTAGCSEPSATCDAARQLSDSVDELFSEETFDGGREAVESSARSVGSDLEELRDAAGEQFGDQIDVLGQEFDELRSSVLDLEPGELRDGLGAVGEEADDTSAAWNRLVADIVDEVEDCDLTA